MALILKSLDDGDTERRIEAGRSFSIGRGTDNDMVLVDPTREVSKTHCRIESDGRGGAFVLVDLSINGVTVDGEPTPMGPGARHTLTSGDVFTIGRQRFAVSFDESPPSAVLGDVALLLPATPSSISGILDGASEGAETRASTGVSNEAARWLGDLPKGSADQTMREPMGWDEPPSTGATALPLDFDQPLASDFANRSEHVPAHGSSMQLPQAQQLIPMDWLDEDVAAPKADSPSPTHLKTSPVPPIQGSTVASSAGLRRAFAEGGRVDPAALSGIDDEELIRRCGATLRAFLDAFDTAEAAQAVAERDCSLPASPETGLWTDFFATNRDPLLSLLVEQFPGPANALGQRAADLADRQRALGHAVADAAQRYDAVLAPAVIEAEGKRRLQPGVIARAAAWTRFVGLHADLAKEAGVDTPSFIAVLRKSFARAMTKRP